MEYAGLNDLQHYVDRNLIRGQHNPHNCVCGWYCFTIVFCRTPPPTHIIATVKARPEHACPDKDCISSVLATMPDPLAAINFDFSAVPAPNSPNPPNPPNPFNGGGASRQSSVARSSPGPGRQSSSTAGHSLAGRSVSRPSVRIPTHPQPQSQPSPRNQTQPQPQPQRSQPQRPQPQRLQSSSSQSPSSQTPTQTQTQRPQRSQPQAQAQQAMPVFHHYQPGRQ
ncbi:predicted protein [Chaetomium globosum CBS 148.51]|uniref:Uncharacterized protein n=1 Tax=Chaetomium globosum (strain ATCC 6205 / CBS 148.51 / DSM 1962 / NBRC 6347 / NRRL 1970) TaxID=306901 RepID=Q2H1E5_CHAGB|nr:uncharacterized protein CHGG_04401 [Chaetomium globosum CBS 148.51]EAQ87782.1 predicted protein [Chaetomium globosum CBS 148.51]